VLEKERKGKKTFARIGSSLFIVQLRILIRCERHRIQPIVVYERKEERRETKERREEEKRRREEKKRREEEKRRKRRETYMIRETEERTPGNT